MNLRVDIDSALAGFQGLRREQLPWTIARALTECAIDGQSAVRDLEWSVFKLRNDWVIRNTKIKPATKTDLVSVVFTDTGNRLTGAPDFLIDQQSGGERIPVGGRLHRAVPTAYLRQMCPGIIPAEMRPRALLEYADLHGMRRTRRGGLRSMSSSIRGMVFFLQNLPGGRSAIYGRYVTDRRAYPLYVLIPEAHLNPIFPMEKEVERIVQETFQQRFKKYAIETMGNDLLRGSGIRFIL